ncbi:tRNA uridine-5-carboxymethylaminomethyl(34) synthesis GTPase MnmE [Sphingomonas hylomeconis]|uniref:tRNA modification GTPase MnmE n=1 Tax=Sphingomonas hylomeconis TaxID=1395958 RepID=A0ABV7SR44_9SPHN|nr:tRNA uridine-5-carboxymethylaminomethyl(34) synthesis GTPase MnmE [Sphingomonas hylomeconis]
MSTIYAVSSGAPPAAIAVLRISGPDALAAATALAGPLPDDRRATLRALRDPADQAILDRALVLVFRAPTTATGEDLVELHLHGGRAVVAAVERTLAVMPGLSPAQPGDFTRRALTNGRIDLTEAEGLGDLLTAETESQRRAAMFTAEGGLRRHVATWSDRILAMSARVEAELDFADEDDVDAADLDAVKVAALRLADEIDALVGQPPVERLRDGIRVVLAGPPNSGKSTLLNALIDRDAAIVSPIAGTTRDRIDAPVHRDGIAYVLTDTAGLAAVTLDPIERMGIERTRSAMDFADVLLWLGDSDAPRGALWVHSRADEAGREVLPAGRDLAVSAATGAGIAALWQGIASRARQLLPRLDEVVLNERQRALAGEAAALLRTVGDHQDPLLIAEQLRYALATIDRITGHSDTEAMLDALFGKFCIGK